MTHENRSARSAPRVPVEDRWLGIDRRTILPGAAALLVALLLIYGWAGIDALLPWHREVRPGQVLDLGDGARATPPVGWQLESGALVGGAGASPTGVNVLLVSGGATIELRGAAFQGDASAFLDRVDRSRTADPALVAGRSTVGTGSGLIGVSEAATSSSGDTLTVALKMATGSPTAIAAAPALLVEARTAPGQAARFSGTIAAVIGSITPGTPR